MESIELMKEKKSIERELKNEDLQIFMQDLKLAREQVKSLANSNLQKYLLEIIDSLRVLRPLGASTVSVINFLAGRKRNFEESGEVEAE